MSEQRHRHVNDFSGPCYCQMRDDGVTTNGNRAKAIDEARFAGLTRAVDHLRVALLAHQSILEADRVLMDDLKTRLERLERIQNLSVGQAEREDGR